jgi:hypothetical protein
MKTLRNAFRRGFGQFSGPLRAAIDPSFASRYPGEEMAKLPELYARKAVYGSTAFGDPAQLRPFEYVQPPNGVIGGSGTVPPRKGRPAPEGGAYSSAGASVAAVAENR